MFCNVYELGNEQVLGLKFKSPLYILASLCLWPARPVSPASPAGQKQFLGTCAGGTYKRRSQFLQFHQSQQLAAGGR